MSTKLKPFLSEIANKLKANGENLYQKFLLYIPDENWDLTKQDWSILNYMSQSIPYVSQIKNGIKVITSVAVQYSGVFIKIGTFDECINKTFTASIDEVEGVSIRFGVIEEEWSIDFFGERSTNSITFKLLPEHTPNGWGTTWFGVWISFDDAGTYNINNITIKNVSPINAKDYSSKIDNVCERNYQEGLDTGYRKWWDDYIVNGIEKSYTGGKYAFAGQAWNDETFNPTRDIYKTYSGGLNCENMFSQCSITDVKGILERNGVKLVTTNAIYFDGFASGAAKITRFPELDMATAQRLSQCFNGCSKLVSIDKIILSSTKTQVFTSTFTGCLALEEIRFEGYIRSNISFSASPLLSKASLESIIGCLYDFVANGDTSAHTLTLHADAKAKLTDSDIAYANQKGWTIA